jgi:hypothetical protein
MNTDNLIKNKSLKKNNKEICNLKIKNKLKVNGSTKLENLKASYVGVDSILVENNSLIEGKLQVIGTSNLQNIEASGDLKVFGTSNLQNIEANGDLKVIGTSNLQNIKANNIKINGDLEVIGNLNINDVVMNNLKLNSTLTFNGGRSIKNLSVDQCHIPSKMNKVTINDNLVKYNSIILISIVGNSPEALKVNFVREGSFDVSFLTDITTDNQVLFNYLIVNTA